MKDLVSSLCLLLFLFAPKSFCEATIIDYAEYFIDTNPGFGNGTEIPISTPESDLTLDFHVDLKMFTLGFHTLYVRAMDQDGNWGIQYSKTVYKTESSTINNILAAEYFIDDDPGIGKGISIPLMPGKDLVLDLTVPLNNLTLGFHKLYIRAMDQDGNWGIQFFRIIFKAQQPTTLGIVAAEYFIDDDPGIGKGISIPLLSGTDITAVFSASLTDLSLGPHILYVKARDENGNYSIIFSQEIVVSIDSDNDLLPDFWEIKYFGDLSHDGTDDSDNDGLTDAEEYFQCTDPTNPDTDGDGIYDGFDNCVNVFNPNQQDSDQDGNGDSCDLCPSIDDIIDHDGDDIPNCIDPTQFYWPMFLPVIMNNSNQ